MDPESQTQLKYISMEEFFADNPSLKEEHCQALLASRYVVRLCSNNKVAICDDINEVRRFAKDNMYYCLTRSDLRRHHIVHSVFGIEKTNW